MNKLRFAAVVSLATFSLGVAACGSEPGPSVATAPSAEATAFAAAAIPDGVYRTDITEADLIAKGASAEFAASNSGVKTWTFAGETYTREDGRGSQSCQGTYEVVGEHLAFTGCDIDGARFTWRPEGDGIRFLETLSGDLTDKDRTEISAYFDRVWSRID